MHGSHRGYRSAAIVPEQALRPAFRVRFDSAPSVRSVERVRTHGPTMLLIAALGVVAGVLALAAIGADWASMVGRCLEVLK